MSTKGRKSIFKPKRKPARKLRLPARGGEAIIDLQPMSMGRGTVYMPTHEAEAMAWRVVGLGVREGLAKLGQFARSNPVACAGVGLFAAGTLVARSR